MSSKTILTCDKCKKAVEIATGSERFCYVRVSVTEQDRPPGNYNVDIAKALSAHWCRACLESAGLVWVAPSNQNPEPAHITIEDLIREIVREEAEARS